MLLKIKSVTNFNRIQMSLIIILLTAKCLIIYYKHLKRD